MRQVVVTGGAGFIGTHLVKALINNGSSVTVIDRVARPTTLPPARRLAFHTIDAYNLQKLKLRPFKNSPIVHLAAETSVAWSVEHPLPTVRSNIGVTCAALEFARKIDSPRFVFASTAAVYGDRTGRCHETDTPAPASPYAVSKLASEYYCRIYATLYGIPTVILRYFNVYGPGQTNHYAGVITHFITRALEGRPPVIFGDGNQTRDFVYIDDVVRATLTALRRSLPGGIVLNIGTGTLVSINSLARTILRLFDLERLTPVHRPPRKGDIRRSLANITAARRELDHQPHYDLEKGLQPTIEWFRGRD